MVAPGPSAAAGPGGAWAAPFRGRIGRATLALIGLRIAYAYNWFSIGPALPAIGTELHVAAAEWGLLLGAFFAGAGALQVPAGLLAARWGTRRVTLLGAGLLGAAACAAGLAPNFGTLVALRALTGAGAGLFFSPAIALVASMHPAGARGVPVGAFSSAYSAGAGLGVFATAIILGALGWRGSLAVGGLAMLLLLVTTAWIIPTSAGAPGVGRRAGRGTPWVFRSVAVWGIGLSFVGLEGASLSAGQFFVPYAELARGWVPALAGAVGALFVFPSFFGGPFGGRLAEQRVNRRTQLALLTAIPAAGLIGVPYFGVVAIALSATFFSFTFGMVYAIMYILPAYLPGLPAEELSLAIGLFNGVQLVGGAVVAFVVGWSIDRFGYTAAWWILGSAVLLSLLALPLIPRTGRTASALGA